MFTFPVMHFSGGIPVEYLVVAGGGGGGRRLGAGGGLVVFAQMSEELLFN